MKDKRTIMPILLLLSLLLVACGTFEVGIERAATPGQARTTSVPLPTPAVPFDLHVLSTPPARQTTSVPVPTPAAPLPGLLYRTTDGFWQVSADGQPALIFDRTGAGGHMSVISPDGTHALYSEKGAGDLDLWLADLSNGERRNLTETPDRTETNFCWWPARPDVILFSSRPQDVLPGPGMTGFLTVVGVDGGYRVLDDQNHTGGLPAPSPDGQTIAYGSGSTGWLYRWETGAEVFDPADYGWPAYKNTHIGSPAWSPDGRKLAWIIGGAFAADESFQMGVGVFDLEARTAQVLHLHEPAFGDGWPAAPVWSPDGKWLAFSAWAQDPDEAGVWVVRADGQQGADELHPTEYYLGGSHPVWSPDGHWLAFNRALQEGGTGAWLAEVGTWALVRLNLNLPSDGYIVDWVSPAAWGPSR